MRIEHLRDLRERSDRRKRSPRGQRSPQCGRQRPQRAAPHSPPEHGFPLRLVVPHLYGYKSPKWLRAIEYLTEDRRGFWEEHGYHNIADPWKEQRYSYQEQEGDGPTPPTS
jgi:hypothetical protein